MLIESGPPNEGESHDEDRFGATAVREEDDYDDDSSIAATVASWPLVASLAPVPSRPVAQMLAKDDRCFQLVMHKFRGDEHWGSIFAAAESEVAALPELSASPSDSVAASPATTAAALPLFLDMGGTPSTDTSDPGAEYFDRFSLLAGFDDASECSFDDILLDVGEAIGPGFSRLYNEAGSAGERNSGRTYRKPALGTSDVKRRNRVLSSPGPSGGTRPSAPSKPGAASDCNKKRKRARSAIPTPAKRSPNGAVQTVLTVGKQTTPKQPLLPRARLAPVYAHPIKVAPTNATNGSQTVAIHSSQGKPSVDPLEYMLSYKIAELAVQIWLTEGCYGYVQSMPVRRAPEILACFCGKRTINKQAMYVFCQSGLYCGHFVHKHCVRNHYLFTTHAQLMSYFSQYTCHYCSGETPPSPQLLRTQFPACVEIAPSSVEGKSSSRTSSEEVTIHSSRASLSSPSPLPPSTPPNTTVITLHRVKSDAAINSPPSTSLFSLSLSAEAANRPEGVVLSVIDANQQVVSSLTSEAGFVHHLTLSEDYYGYLSFSPALQRSRTVVRLCYCKKPYSSQAQYLYCKRGKCCNHYVHIHCVPELFYRKLYTYFRNNYVCRECSLETPSEEAKSLTYWE